jgi:hypothetical protein
MSCFLAVQVETQASQFSFVKISKVGVAEKIQEKLSIGKAFETNQMKLTFAGLSTDSMV